MKFLEKYLYNLNLNEKKKKRETKETLKIYTIKFPYDNIE